MDIQKRLDDISASEWFIKAHRGGSIEFESVVDEIGGIRDGVSDLIRELKQKDKQLKTLEAQNKMLIEGLEKVKERQDKIKDSTISQKTVTWHIADKALAKAKSTESE